MQADLAAANQSEASRVGWLFGLWGSAGKLPLALVAGIALPLLDIREFEAGTTSGQQTLLAIRVLYAGAPLLFKLIAVRVA